MKQIKTDIRDYESEYRFKLDSLDNGETIAFISGGVFAHRYNIIGNSDDDITELYAVSLDIGPYWRKLTGAVPQVSISGFYNSDSDEDDVQKWRIRGVNWKRYSVSFAGQKATGLRITFILEVNGESSKITKLAYTCVCQGLMESPPTLLNRFNINTPGPVHYQGNVSRYPFQNDPFDSFVLDEFRHQYALNSSETNVALSGKKGFEASELIGDDWIYRINTKEFLVGPAWRDVSNVTLFVNNNGFNNSDSDEDDTQSWSVHVIHWEKVYGFGPGKNEFRIKLTIDIGLMGDNSKISSISYFLFATGVLGEHGLEDRDIRLPAETPSIIYINSAVRNNNSNLTYEKEHRLAYRALVPDNSSHVVFSGNVDVYPEHFSGSPDDDNVQADFNLILYVGPYWREVTSAVPHVFIAGFENTNADEDDVTLREIPFLQCVAAKGFGPDENEFQIGLNVAITMKGGNSRIISIGYFVSAIGRLGEKGLDYPNPPSSS